MITTIFTIVITVLVIVVVLLSLAIFQLYGTVAELTQKMYQQFKLNEFVVNKLEDLDTRNNITYWGPKGEA
jgi:predicted Holliday junction resolvase-like endonuclease